MDSTPDTVIVGAIVAMNSRNLTVTKKAIEEGNLKVKECAKPHAKLTGNYLDEQTTPTHQRERPAMSNLFCDVCGMERKFHGKTCSTGGQSPLVAPADSIESAFDSLQRACEKTVCTLAAREPGLLSWNAMLLDNCKELNRALKGLGIPPNLMMFILLFLSLATSLNAQTWSLVFSNNLDGWKGPVAVSEISADGTRILKTIPLDYKQFLISTNEIWVTNSFFPNRWQALTNGWPIMTNQWKLYIDTNTLNQIIEDGQVCKIKGHLWQPGCGVLGCLVNHGDIPMRHCAVCKRRETRELGPWK